MRSGIIIQHSKELSRTSSLVQSDRTGFIGVVVKSRWPKNASVGDFFEVKLGSYSELVAKPARHFFDPVTRRAIRAFFDNGGVNCVLFGLCIESKDSLMVEDPFAECFLPLLDRLRGEEDIGILAMPILAYLPVDVDDKGNADVKCQPVMELLLQHCHEMTNRFLVLDTPQDLHETALGRWVYNFREKNSEFASFGAIYYPWLQAGDEVYPPSGAVTGVFARVDQAHAPFGVRWPPANEVIRGATHAVVDLKYSEAETLTNLGINPLMIQQSTGVVIWGARTMSKDPRWKFINSRRIVSFVSEQLRRDSEWVVFENQTSELWATVARMVRSRLDELWTAGLLTGDREGEEYMVKCDRELNPPEVVDAGRVNVQVQIKPVSTTESIVIELRLGG